MKMALAAAAVALAVGGCGSGDDAEESTKRRPPRAGEAVFRSERIGFTFAYPKTFHAEKRPRDGVLAQVALRRRDRLNAMQIRRVAKRELPFGRYLDEFHRDFERTFGEVDKRRARVGALDVGVLEFEDTIRRGGDRVTVSSTSYFFRGAGSTWQFECLAQPAHASAVEEACTAALETIKFKPSRSRARTRRGS